MTATIEEAKQWARENTEDLDQRRLSCECEDVQFFNRVIPDKSEERRRNK
jgi:hypothetical protein